MMRIGVLASGSGSNLQAILDACASGEVPAQVAAVICNVPGARALERAQKAGVPAILLPHQGFPSREAYDAELVRTLRAHGATLVCLAGFMRLISRTLLDAFENKILNIHPSLLPAFPGMHAVRQALQAGVRVSGCTVHVVDAGIDTGPILVQAAVRVYDSDTEETLAARILTCEHRCYPHALRLFAEGRVSVQDGRARIEAGPRDEEARLFSPDLPPAEGAPRGAATPGGR
jgi:phosphoribosylglycinamide formyltransferase-1